MAALYEITSVLAAAHFTPVNRASDQGATRTAKDRAKRSGASAIKFAAKQSTDGRTDEEARRAVSALAIIAPIIPTPDTVIIGQALRRHIPPATIIAILMPIIVCLAHLFLVTAAIGRGMSRRIRKKRGRWHRERREHRCDYHLTHDL
jgi:hypothetical protein